MSCCGSEAVKAWTRQQLCLQGSKSRLWKPLRLPQTKILGAQLKRNEWAEARMWEVGGTRFCGLGWRHCLGGCPLVVAVLVVWRGCCGIGGEATSRASPYTHSCGIALPPHALIRMHRLASPYTHTQALYSVGHRRARSLHRLAYSIASPAACTCHASTVHPCTRPCFRTGHAVRLSGRVSVDVRSAA